MDRARLSSTSYPTIFTQTLQQQASPGFLKKVYQSSSFALLIIMSHGFINTSGNVLRLKLLVAKVTLSTKKNSGLF